MASRYMMATLAFHKLGDISSEEPDICSVHEEIGAGYIGSWVTGFGFINVFFPRCTTRELTQEEREYYRGLNYQLSSQPPFKLDIPDPEPADA